MNRSIRFTTYLVFFSGVIMVSFISCGRSIIVVDYEAQIDSLKRVIAECDKHNEAQNYGTVMSSSKTQYKLGDTIIVGMALGVIDERLNQSIVLDLDTSSFELLNYDTDSIKMGPTALGNVFYLLPKKKGKLNFKGHIHFTPWNMTKKYTFEKNFEVK